MNWAYLTLVDIGSSGLHRGECFARAQIVLQGMNQLGLGCLHQTWFVCAQWIAHLMSSGCYLGLGARLWQFTEWYMWPLRVVWASQCMVSVVREKKKNRRCQIFRSMEKPQNVTWLPSNKLNLSVRSGMHMQGGERLNTIIYRDLLGKKLCINHTFVISSTYHFFS